MTSTTTTATTPVRTGRWTGWVLALGAVLVTTTLQTLFVLPTPAPSLTVSGWVLAVVSYVVTTVGLWLVARGCARTVHRGTARTTRGLVWTAALLLVVVAVGVVLPFAVLVVVIPVAWLLAGVAVGEVGPLRGGFRAVRAAPGRHLVAALVTLLLVGLAWLAAVVLGLFLTGPVGFAATWLWFGITTMVVLRWWCGLHHRGLHPAA